MGSGYHVQLDTNAMVRNVGDLNDLPIRMEPNNNVYLRDVGEAVDAYAIQTSRVRINGKRARYAVEAVAGVLGGEAVELANALAGVQELLGEHQDAAVAADTWLAIANADPDDHALAVTAGRLFERERTAVRAARYAFPAAWKAASRRRLTEWMR